MRRTTKGMTTVACDGADCTMLFRTYSIARVARRQAMTSGGFLRVKLNRIANWWALGLGSCGSKLLDMCANCAAQCSPKAIRIPKETTEKVAA